MKPTYTEHARLRMAERGISEEEVEAVLTDHVMSWTDRKGNPIYIGLTGGRRITVVVSQGSNPPHISR